MDYLLLEYEIKRSGLTKTEFLKEINMPVATYYRKTHGISQFTLPEIKTICKVLKLESPLPIFFND